MNIFQLNQILLEYNKSGKLTTIAGQGGDKAAGKSFDNIAAGITDPYKQENKEPTEVQKQYPQLAKVINQMKKDQIKGNKVVVGGALNELKMLVQNKTLRKDENNETILPFGDQIRLIQKGNNYFIRLKSVADKENNNQEEIDILGQQLPTM